MVFHTYRKIYSIGHRENSTIFSDPEDEIVIQEKIDGGNFRFYITENNKIIFGSRNQQLTSDTGEDTNVAKGFKRCVDYVREKLFKGDDLLYYQGYIFYGECCVKHTITYDFDKMPPFLGFDVLDTGTDKFLGWEAMEQIYSRLGLETVPRISLCTAKDIVKIDDTLVPISKYALESAKDKYAEGIVFKNYGKQVFAKYVRDKFKEKNAEEFGGNPKYNADGVTNDAEFLFKYCTNPRIEKNVFKMVDESMYLDMTLMGPLIKRTYEDIIAENWHEILVSNWVLDFKDCRQKIAIRCRAVLSSMITNNALQGEQK